MQLLYDKGYNTATIKGAVYKLLHDVESKQVITELPILSF